MLGESGSAFVDDRQQDKRSDARSDAEPQPGSPWEDIKSECTNSSGIDDTVPPRQVLHEDVQDDALYQHTLSKDAIEVGRKLRAIPQVNKFLFLMIHAK